MELFTSQKAVSSAVSALENDVVIATVWVPFLARRDGYKESLELFNRFKEVHREFVSNCDAFLKTDVKQVLDSTVLDFSKVEPHEPGRFDGICPGCLAEDLALLFAMMDAESGENGVPVVPTLEHVKAFNHLLVDMRMLVDKLGESDAVRDQGDYFQAVEYHFGMFYGFVRDALLNELHARHIN